MKEELKQVAINGVIIVSQDGEGVYTWVAASLEEARIFIKKNLAEIYEVHNADVSTIWDIGDWEDFGNVKYMVDSMSVV